LGDTEDDRNRRCCSFGRERSLQGAGRGNDGDLSVDEIGHECRQAIVLTLQPVVLDRHVLAFDDAGFVEAIAESDHVARGGFGRTAAKESDHRQRRLLRIRAERPRNRRAADNGNELPSADVDCHVTPPQWDHDRCEGRKNITLQNAGLWGRLPSQTSSAVEPWRIFNYLVKPLLGWPGSHYCSEQGADACS